jgi:Protein of unknown function (DUF3489)
MPQFNTAPPNQARPGQPRARRSRAAKSAATEHARQDKIVENRQQCSDCATGARKQQPYLEPLRRRAGATVDELASIGWQPHSVRGILSGTVERTLGLTPSSDQPGDGSRRSRVGPEA